MGQQSDCTGSNGDELPCLERGMYANFLQRLCSYIIDFLILIIPASIFGYAAALALAWRINEVCSDQACAEDLSGSIGQGAAVIAMLIYFTLFESSNWSATPGKKLLGLKVIYKNGSKLSAYKAFERNFCKLFSFLTLYIGFLMPIWTKRRQTLHDKISNCFVVKIEM